MPGRREAAMNRAILVSATFSRSPISKTKVSPGARAARAERKNPARFSGTPKSQCGCSTGEDLGETSLLKSCGSFQLCGIEYG